MGKAGQAVMASLWKTSKNMKIKTKRPSSKYYDNSYSNSHDKRYGRCYGKEKDFARNPKKLFRKKLSLSALLCREARAGMTVEAAVVLPICLLFLINLGSLMETVRLHGNLQFALWDAGGRVAMYGCGQSQESITGIATGFYIGSKIRESLGQDYLDGSPLAKGSAGLLLWETGLSETGNELDIKLTYQVAPMSPLAGFRSFYMANRCYVRLWNGYDVAGAEEVMTYVYVAEHGSVFHRDRNCTHIRLSTRNIAREELGGLRNQWGQKYAACDKCAGGSMPEALYVTDDGSCYHYRGDCPGLKRSVISMTPEEAAGYGYPPCSRCGGD